MTSENTETIDKTDKTGNAAGPGKPLETDKTPVKITPMQTESKTVVPEEVVTESDPVAEAIANAATAEDEVTVANKAAVAEKKAPQGAAKKVRQPRKRIPLGTRNVLTAPKRPGFVRRFVNDKGDRLQNFKDAGWAAVGADEQIGDDKAGKATLIGSSANPSIGGGQRAVLMEIPEKYYEEDKKAKQDEITQVENEIRRNSTAPGKDGLDGKISIT